MPLLHSCLVIAPKYARGGIAGMAVQAWNGRWAGGNCLPPHSIYPMIQEAAFELVRRAPSRLVLVVSPPATDNLRRGPDCLPLSPTSIPPAADCIKHRITAQYQRCVLKQNFESHRSQSRCAQSALGTFLSAQEHKNTAERQCGNGARTASGSGAAGAPSGVSIVTPVSGVGRTAMNLNSCSRSSTACRPVMIILF